MVQESKDSHSKKASPGYSPETTKAKIPLWIVLTFSLSAIALGAMLTWNSSKDVLPFVTDSDEKSRIESLWNRDLYQLMAMDQLPKAEWALIKETKWRFLADDLKARLTGLNLNIPNNSEGKYHLEIDIDRWTDEKSVGYFIEYRLVNEETGNVDWELGRTLIL
ncbi:MAG: hypothetical protein COT74_08175 [Bdellovibrionales bacterium CG10_big_fil_rev_8_21_14_0_10_45_34]|nr:MAG: hypothetical protein COT74_08175 [Bdellovibrionales bacterium CG10_big_fil_rev_8_21_14_0_10_45_34]